MGILMQKKNLKGTFAHKDLITMKFIILKHTEKFIVIREAKELVFLDSSTAIIT